jgi:hypothetical protein
MEFTISNQITKSAVKASVFANVFQKNLPKPQDKEHVLQITTASKP